MQSARHITPIVTKPDLSRQIFIQVPCIKYDGNPSSGIRPRIRGRMGGRSGRQKGALRDFAKSALRRKNMATGQLRLLCERGLRVRHCTLSSYTVGSYVTHWTLSHSSAVICSACWSSGIFPFVENTFDLPYSNSLSVIQGRQDPMTSMDVLTSLLHGEGSFLRS